MINYPTILENPNDVKFHLDEGEIYLFKEAKELISIQHYSYSLFAIWNATIINLQKRIEFFGINNLLEILEKKEDYNSEGNSLKDRWLNINEYTIIGIARTLNLISHTTHDLISALYWMKSSTNTEAQKKIDETEIYCLLYLLEKNLFLKKYKKDMRTHNENDISQNRRKEDNENITTNLQSETSLSKPVNTQAHDELLLKSNMQKFEKQTKEDEENEHLIDKYI